MPVLATQLPQDAGMALTLNATVVDVDAAVDALHKYFLHAGLGNISFDLEVMAREAFLNAAMHGCNGEAERLVRATVRVLPQCVVLDVADDGPGFNWEAALAAPPPDPAQESGRGIYILQHYADELHFTPEGNALRIVKRRPAKEPQMSQKVYAMPVRISAQDAPALREHFKGFLQEGVRELVLDFAQVESIDSVGIGLLAAAHNSLAKSGGSLSIVHASYNVYQLLTLMRLDKHFAITQA